MIRSTLRGVDVRSIDARMWLSGRVELDQIRKIAAIQATVHGVAIEDDDKIHVAGRIGERALPQAIGVLRPPLPWPAIFGVHHLAQRNPRLFHYAHMLAEVHQVRSAYLGSADPAGPPQSPLAGDCAGLPPLLIACGDAEMLRDDAVRFADRAVAAGVPVDLEVFEGMPHGFPVLSLDASRVLLSRVAAFAAARLG